jgi:hypothetical protein
MSLRLHAIFTLLIAAFFSPVLAWAEGNTNAGVHLELNSVQDTGNACRLTFVAENKLDREIEKAVFETVIFDQSGGVMLLSLFDFRELPLNKPRVRQFDVPGQTCSAISRVLINGANTCSVGGAEIDACGAALNVSSRIDVELLG